MTVLNFIIAIIALILSIYALRKTGGLGELRKSTSTILEKMQKAVSEDKETGDKND
ncbi:MAG: hypothetical protein SVZ03_07260 [Spirochaetota bacterium]|nr:hypothetical protein [Spirochaetota bacterium]